jgi:hypothetical protein
MSKRLKVINYDDVVKGCKDEKESVIKFNKWLDKLEDDCVMYLENIGYMVLKSKGIVIENYKVVELEEEVWEVWSLDEWRVRMFES